MRNKNHPSETLPIDNSCQTGLPLFSGGVFYMREIKLSQFGKNKGKYVALVDDEDFDSVNQYKWSATKLGNNFYAMRGQWVDGKYTTKYMHSMILDGKEIDHIDHNGLNNQKSNLRLCTRSENSMNKTKRRGVSSIYKGVSFFKKGGKWMAQITSAGKSIYLGYFVCEIDAARAYNTKATELFGEFANLNQIN